MKKILFLLYYYYFFFGIMKKEYLLVKLRKIMKINVIYIKKSEKKILFLEKSI